MKHAKQIYLTIIIVCLVVLVTSIYYALGGFDKLEVYEFEGTNRTVIGKHYIGKFSPEEIMSFTQEAKLLIDSGRLNGQLVLVDYQSDTIGPDSTHYFIGASFDEIRNIIELPARYTFEEYRTDKIYRVFIVQHPLVRPLPAEIRTLMEVKAITDGQVLLPYTFDLYYEDGSWCTEGWVKLKTSDP